jgi:hypothetical protein
MSTVISDVRISKESYQENKLWIRKHPELSLGCYIRRDRAGDLHIRLERISDTTSNTARYIPGWQEVPYPDFLAGSLFVPRHVLDENTHSIPLEWV